MSRPSTFTDADDVKLAELHRKQEKDKDVYTKAIGKGWPCIKGRMEHYLGLDLSFMKERRILPLLKDRKPKRKYTRHTAPLNIKAETVTGKPIDSTEEVRRIASDIDKAIKEINSEANPSIFVSLKGAMPEDIKPTSREIHSINSKSNIEIVADWYLAKLNAETKVHHDAKEERPNASK